MWIQIWVLPYLFVAFGKLLTHLSHNFLSCKTQNNKRSCTRLLWAQKEMKGINDENSYCLEERWWLKKEKENTWKHLPHVQSGYSINMSFVFPKTFQFQNLWLTCGLWIKAIYHFPIIMLMIIFIVFKLAMHIHATYFFLISNASSNSFQISDKWVTKTLPYQS